MNYDQKLANLRARKLQQTRDKIEQEGVLDEDDYGGSYPRKAFGRSGPTTRTDRSMVSMPGPTIFAA